MSSTKSGDAAAEPAAKAGSGRRKRSAPGEPRALRYQHVYDLVINLIADGGLKEGDKLPSTAELAELADVSVISVRRALDELAHAGKILRHQGVGTFVAPQRILSQPARSGALLGTISGTGGVEAFTTELLSITVGLPSPSHAEALSIDDGQPVWEVCRLRSLKGQPKVVEKAILPLSRVPSLDKERLANGDSLYDYLEEKFSLTDTFVEQFFQVDLPTKWEQKHLRVAAKDSVVRVRGVSFSTDELAFDSYQQTYRAHDFMFYVAGSQSPKLVEPVDNGEWTVEQLGGAPS